MRGSKRIISVCVILSVILTAVLVFGCPAPAPEVVPTPVAPAVPEPEVKPEVEPIIWKVQGFVPAGMIYHNTLLHFAETLDEVSNGRLTLDVHPKGAIVPTGEGLTATDKGVLDAHYGFAAQWMGKIPSSALFTSVPGGFETMGHLMWLYHGGGNELYQEMFDTYGYNVKVFPVVATSMQIFQWSDKPCRSLDDFEGLKMRMMPLMGDILKAHGFSVAYLPAGEIIPALERGVLDAAEYATPAFDITAGFNDICKYYHYPGVHQPACILDFTVNKDSYAALPDDLKVILEQVTYSEIFWAWQNEEDLCLKALEEFDKGGNVLVRMDEETIATMQEWCVDYLDEQAAKDAFFAKVLKSIRAWESKWYPYEQANRLPRD